MSLHIFSLRCPALARAQQGEGEERKKDTYRRKKTQPNSKRGRKINCHPFPQNTNDAEDDRASLKLELHLERASDQPPEGLSKGHTKDRTCPSPARKVDLNPGLHIKEHPSFPQPSAPSFSPSQESTPLACSCCGEAELKLQPALLHERHQQQSQATETAPEESCGVRGARLLHAYRT